MATDTDEFVKLLTASQGVLYGSILALLPDRALAQDVLQETNLTLWHKAAEFQPGTNFLAWARRIAHYHVLNQRRKMRRERVVFDDELVSELGERQSEREDDVGRYADALRKCLDKLPVAQQELLAKRYSQGGSVEQISAAEGKSAGAISQTLYRIRESLLNCVHEQLRVEAS